MEQTTPPPSLPNHSILSQWEALPHSEMDQRNPLMLSVIRTHDAGIFNLF